MIQLLSPVNKRPGPDGADAYEQKRQELFVSGMHLLEIDLLRVGKRPQIAASTVLPDAPYFVFLSRAERRPEIALWACTFRKPLPNVPVPLHRPDPDAVLPLASLLQRVYRNALPRPSLPRKTRPGSMHSCAKRGCGYERWSGCAFERWSALSESRRWCRP